MLTRLIHWLIAIAAVLWLLGFAVDLMLHGAITESCCLP
jgi:hypothetical protein